MWIILAALFILIGLSAGISGQRVVAAEEVVSAIRAGGPVDFHDCTIVGDLDVSSLKIKGPVHFNHTVFQNSAVFDQAIFKDEADFRGAAFNGHAGFGGTRFNDHADFIDVSFNGYAYFVGASFNDTAEFQEASFNGNTDFGGAWFKRGASFWNAQFNGDASFWMAGFNSYTGFENATFNVIEFAGAKFDEEASFEDASFTAKTNFEKAGFKEDAIFENATFEDELTLNKTRYSKLFIRWHSIRGGLAYDDAAYMALMKNFKDLGYSVDYDSCYYAYRNAQRSQRGWTPLEEAFRKAIEYPMQWFYGYGTKPLNAFFWSLSIVLTFSLIWWALGLGGPKDKTREHLEKGEEWLDGDLFDLLGFSATVFLSGTRLLIDPPPMPRIEGRSRSMIKKAFVLERVLGALFSVMFFIAISGTIVRAS